MTKTNEETMITVTINGREKKTLPGITILQLLIREGIDIPHLCYDPRLAHPNANCGVCVVQVDDDSRFVKSCENPVRDGMAIVTNTKELEAYRKIRIQQILADHNADCVAPCVTTCPASIDIQS